MGAFTKTERTTLRAIVEWAVPVGATSLDDVVAAIDDHFAKVPREPRLFVKAGLLAMDVGARLRHGRRLAGLDPVERDRVLRWWLENRSYGLRSLAKAVYLNVVMAYYAQPGVRERQGFRPEQLVALRDKLRILDPRAVASP